MAKKKSQAQIEFTAETSEFKRGIADANKSIKSFKDELKLNEVQLKNDANNVDLLTQRKELLVQQTEESKRKIRLLSETLEAAKRNFGENSTETEQLTRKLRNAQIEYENIQSDVIRTDKRFNDLKDAASKLGTEVGDLGEKTEDAGDDLKDLAKNAKDTDDGFTVAKGAIAGFIANGLTALVGAAKNAISSLFNLAQETREFRQDLSTLDTAFSNVGFSTETATNTWKDLYAIFGEDDRAVEAANNIARMADNEKELNEWVKITTGIWGTYQDALPVEGLAEAAGETAKTGQVTGVLADALNWSSDAAVMFSKYMNEDVTNAEDAFNVALSECNTEAERQALITETLTKLYGGAADEYENTAGSIMDANKATADQSLAMAELGERMEPLTTKVTEGVTDIVNAFLGMTEDADLESIGDTIDDAFSFVVEDVIPKIKDGFQWIIDNKDGLIAGITGIGAAFAAFKVVTIIQGVVDALKGMTAAQIALNIAQSLNPMGLIVAAIVGLVAAIVVLWKKSDTFRNFVLGMFDAIKSAASTVWEWLKSVWNGLITALSSFGTWVDTNVIRPVISFFQGLGEKVSAVWDGIVFGVTTFVQLIASIFNAAFQIITLPFRFIWENCKQYVFDAIEWIKEKVNTGMELVKTYIINPIKSAYNSVVTWFTNMKDAIATKITEIRDKVTEIFNAIKEKITGPINTAKTAVTNAFTAIKDGITNRINSARDTVTKVFNTIKEKITGPINTAKEAVTSAFTSIKDGVTSRINTLKSNVTSVFNSIKDKITGPVEKARDKVKEIVDKIKGFFNFTMPTPKIKLPKFAISPSGWKLSDLLEGSIPKLSITWNKDGAIFTRPTVFNTAQGAQGVGEAGAEAILPLDRLEKWVNNSMQTGVNNAVNASSERLERLIEVAEEILAKPSDTYLNGRRVSEGLGATNDAVSGNRLTLKERGLAL